jgi:phage tail sheath gpL-like
MSSPNIDFDTIPASIRKPGTYTEVNTSLAVRSLPGNAQKVCVIAQKTASGSVVANTVTKTFSDADAALYFGAGSQAHMAVKALLDVNPYVDLDVLPVADSGSTKAVGLLGFTGMAGAAGYVTAYVDNEQAQASVADGDSATVVATALYAALGNISQNIPVTPGLTGAYITLTAKNAGTNGNYIPVTCKVTACEVVGGDTGIFETTTAMASGATDPDLGSATSGILSNVAAGGYNIFVMGGIQDATNAAKMKTFVDFVSNSVEQRPTVAVYGYTDLVGVLANAETFAGTTLNSGRFEVAYLPSATTIGLEASPTKLAGAFAAALASEQDPARPLNGLVLTGIPAPAVSDRLTRTMQESLLYNGVTPLIVNSGEQVAICRAISTYVTNGSGIEDPSLLDITTIRTVDYTRLAVRTRLELRFPRSKLSARTEKAVKAEVLDVLYLLEQLEILENVTGNEGNVIVERDLQDPNRLNIRIPTDVVNGLMIKAVRLDLLL